MGRRRKKEDIQTQLAFESIFAKSRAAKIDPDTEDALLDAFTQYCDTHDVQDVPLSGLKELLGSDLKVDAKLLEFLDPEEFRLETTEDVSIVDFDKFLHMGALYLKLNETLDIVDSMWEMMLAGIKGKARLNGSERASAYKTRLYLKDLQEVSKNTKMGLSMDELVRMLTVSNNGERVWLNYLDFALVLGRIGVLTDIN